MLFPSHDQLIWYDQVPLEQQDFFSNTGQTFWLDWANETINLGQTATNTVNVYYTEYSADLTASDTWQFPERFHSLIPYKMAEIYYAADAGEKARAWDDRWSAQFERMLNRAYQWNDSIKVRNRLPGRDRYNPKAIN